MVSHQAQRYSLPSRFFSRNTCGSSCSVMEMQRGFFSSTKRWLRKCYDERYISYIGSDAHNVTDRPPLSEENLKWFRDNIDKEYMAQLFGGGHFVNN